MSDRDRIFISYRKPDGEGFAHSLLQTLQSAFGEPRVFLDLDGIQVGEHWIDHLNQQLARACALVVVIDPSWEASFARRRSLIDTGDRDWVVHEIGYALANPEIELIPLLMGGCTPPDRLSLPSEISDLVNVQHAKVTYPTWEQDLRPVLDRLQVLLARDVMLRQLKEGDASAYLQYCSDYSPTPFFDSRYLDQVPQRRLSGTNESPESASVEVSTQGRDKDLLSNDRGLLFILGDSGSGKTQLLGQLRSDAAKKVLAGTSDRVPMLIDVLDWDETLNGFSELIRAERTRQGCPTLPAYQLILLIDGLADLDDGRHEVALTSILTWHRRNRRSLIIATDSKNRTSDLANRPNGVDRIFHLRPFSFEERKLAATRRGLNDSDANRVASNDLASIAVFLYLAIDRHLLVLASEISDAPPAIPSTEFEAIDVTIRAKIESEFDDSDSAQEYISWASEFAVLAYLQLKNGRFRPGFAIQNSPYGLGHQYLDVSLRRGLLSATDRSKRLAFGHRFIQLYLMTLQLQDNRDQAASFLSEVYDVDRSFDDILWLLRSCGVELPAEPLKDFLSRLDLSDLVRLRDGQSVVEDAQLDSAVTLAALRAKSNGERRVPEMLEAYTDGLRDDLLVDEIEALFDGLDVPLMKAGLRLTRQLDPRRSTMLSLRVLREQKYPRAVRSTARSELRSVASRDISKACAEMLSEGSHLQLLETTAEIICRTLNLEPGNEPDLEAFLNLMSDNVVTRLAQERREEDRERQLSALATRLRRAIRTRGRARSKEIRKLRRNSKADIEAAFREVGRKDQVQWHVGCCEVAARLGVLLPDEQLVDLVNHDEVDVQLAALKLIRHVGNQGHAKLIQPFLYQRHRSSVRSAAIRTLGSISPSKLQRTVALARDGAGRQSRRPALGLGETRALASVLSQVGGEDSLALARRFVQHQDRVVVARACAALETLGTKDDVGLLLSIAARGEERTSKSALKAIATLGDATAAPKLLRLLRRPGYPASLEAFRAYAQLGGDVTILHDVRSQF